MSPCRIIHPSCHSCAYRGVRSKTRPTCRVFLCPKFAAIAPAAEQPPCKRMARGSNPRGGTILASSTAVVLPAVNRAVVGSNPALPASFTCSQDSPRECLDVDSRIVRRTESTPAARAPLPHMLSEWRETEAARSMQWGVDAGKVFGRQRGKTRTPIQALASVGAFPLWAMPGPTQAFFL